MPRLDSLVKGIYSVFASMTRHDVSLDDLRQRIRPEVLAERGFPEPKQVVVSTGTDSAGDEAYYIYLVFSNKTPEKDLAWRKVEPMVSWVRDLVWRETGAKLWPYVKVKLEKQLPARLN